MIIKVLLSKKKNKQTSGLNAKINEVACVSFYTFPLAVASEQTLLEVWNHTRILCFNDSSIPAPYTGPTLLEAWRNMIGDFNNPSEPAATVSGEIFKPPRETKQKFDNLEVRFDQQDLPSTENLIELARKEVNKFLDQLERNEQRLAELQRNVANDLNHKHDPFSKPLQHEQFAHPWFTAFQVIFLCAYFGSLIVVVVYAVSGWIQPRVRSVTKRRTRTDHQIHELENKCSICWDSFGEQPITVTSKCHHVFHTECYNRWDRVNGVICPQCTCHL